MQFRFSFKHMETSQALQNYAKEKIRVEVEKFVTKPIEAHVTFSVERYQHQVLCSLAGGDGFTVNVEHACADMYGSVDHMIDKMVTQLKKKKEKLKDHKHPKAVIPFGSIEPADDFEAVVIDAADIVKFEKVVKQRR
ncbi:MAG TPA: ribosome-associated translation inhibitor RaiA [Oligoflexus sp.]|uniref:ribosome hibernation-promoting factor, HPF/YfiA family n=1 Tax=Oligoflexus sp. TaxID=1971216 RepID=UPI002D2A200B|nr:ribosome-associated translation inhibitor RaiA [Oligoflexus sp.]HYX39530.1 ribosome-associated translation inhibitor RaiA [Oligoflexus sp.]